MCITLPLFLCFVLHARMHAHVYVWYSLLCVSLLPSESYANAQRGLWWPSLNEGCRLALTFFHYYYYVLHLYSYLLPHSLANTNHTVVWLGITIHINTQDTHERITVAYEEGETWIEREREREWRCSNCKMYYINQHGFNSLCIVPIIIVEVQTLKFRRADNCYILNKSSCCALIQTFLFCVSTLHSTTFVTAIIFTKCWL